MGGEVWLKTRPRVNRQRKFCLVPPTIASCCAILGLLAVLLVCRGEDLKAKALGLVMTLSFDISCCGEPGLWPFWKVRAQSPREGRAQLRQSRTELPWWAALLPRRVGKCVERDSWLHIKESVYSTCRFLRSCFLSDNNNKNIFSLLFFISVFRVSVCWEVKECSWLFAAERAFFCCCVLSRSSCFFLLGISLS